MLGGLSVLWGGSFFFVEFAVATLPPVTLVALRVGLAAVVLNLALPAMGRTLPRKRSVWAAFLAMGLLNDAIPFSLIAWGQAHVIHAAAGATNLLLLTFLIPVNAVALGTALLGERLVGHHGVGMGLIGPSLAAIDGRPLRAVRAASARRAEHAAALPAFPPEGYERGDR